MCRRFGAMSFTRTARSHGIGGLIAVLACSPYRQRSVIMFHSNSTPDILRCNDSAGFVFITMLRVC